MARSSNTADANVAAFAARFALRDIAGFRIPHGSARLSTALVSRSNFIDNYDGRIARDANIRTFTVGYTVKDDAPVISTFETRHCRNTCGAT